MLCGGSCVGIPASLFSHEADAAKNPKRGGAGGAVNTVVPGPIVKDAEGAP